MTDEKEGRMSLLRACVIRLFEWWTGLDREELQLIYSCYLWATRSRWRAYWLVLAHGREWRRRSA